MKKLISLLLLCLSIQSFAQNDVTKFLGIPVDGTKSAMIQKLKEKGFVYNTQKDELRGEFNGKNVIINVVTYHNKVWRIVVMDAIPCDESNIKIRFNDLCYQFAHNDKYTRANFGEKEYTIPDEEDISFEMIAHSKRYQAAYLQAPEIDKMDSLTIQQKMAEAISKHFTQEEIQNANEEQQAKIHQIIQEESYNIVFDIMKNKSVWFMIHEEYGKYSILMYYDNEYNHVVGDDL